MRARRAPRLAEGALAGARAHPARPATQAALGWPESLVPEWEAVAAAAVGEAVRGHRGLQVWMDACMRCGVCTDKCHYFLGSGDPKNMPVARQDLFRSVYRRYHTFLGRRLPWLVGARRLTPELLEDWYVYFHQCSQCRRCAVYCPVGIDTAEFSMAARGILNRIGLGQRFTSEIIEKAERVGNNLGLPRPALADTLAGLEAEIRETTGARVRLPLDEPGAEVLLVTPSADFFAEPHVEGLMGYAKVLHQAGISWTLSSHASEAANFALFVGDTGEMRTLASRIREAARELGARRLVLGECGHAWRVAYGHLERLAGPLDFLDPRFPRPQHIVEVTHDLIERRALRLDPAANDHRHVTYHDSCNIARASRMGDRADGQLVLPREVLRAACRHFHDMAPPTIGRHTLCCGAGAGLAADELKALRVSGARPRMDAYAEVVRRHGVTHLVAICAICKSQLSQVFPEFGFSRESVLSLHQLVGDALVL